MAGNRAAPLRQTEGLLYLSWTDGMPPSYVNRLGLIRAVLGCYPGCHTSETSRLPILEARKLRPVSILPPSSITGTHVIGFTEAHVALAAFRGGHAVSGAIIGVHHALSVDHGPLDAVYSTKNSGID